MDKGRFPRPIRLGARAVGWRSSTIEEWLSAPLPQVASFDALYRQNRAENHSTELIKRNYHLKYIALCPSLFAAIRLIGYALIQPYALIASRESILCFSEGRAFAR
ncbi:AlpA family phage regulatory protein [Sphingomonas sp. MM-1]|uniref:helix-turn-helix transcriptional regulator n=1 Tax=Sphingomonas sp. MM-1 TaxID=745310 RepID=UPI000A0036D9